jgi:hypothetical protein
MSPAARDLARGVLLPLLVLGGLSGFANAWPTLWPQPRLALSVELAGALLVLVLAAAWQRRPPTRLVRALALIATAGVALHYIDVTVPAVLGRRVNLYWDLPHLGAVTGMDGSGAAGWRTVVAVLLAGALLVVLYRIVRACFAALAQRATRPLVGWSLGAGCVATLLLWGAASGMGSAAWMARLFAPPVSAMVAEQIRFLHSALARDASALRLGAGPRFVGNLDALGGADVLIVFAEAYGAVTFDQPSLAAALATSRARFAAAIERSGRTVVSARVVSPTFGGASWLAHGALLAGIDTRDPADHALLLSTDRPTLVRHFSAHGYRTVGWMPGLQRPWPEGRFYGFERIADADGGGYAGLPFGFWRIPDQASMALIHEQEFGGRFAGEPAPGAGRSVGAPRRPRLVVFPTVSTHAPFAALPPLAEDWSRLTGAEAFSREAVAAAEALPVSWTDALPAYLAAMRYQFGWLTAYVADHAPADLVLIVIGDHQPIGAVSGPEQPWEVPVHVVSRDRALLARLERAGFVPGLMPAQPPLGPMHWLTQVLVDAFSAEP